MSDPTHAAPEPLQREPVLDAARSSAWIVSIIGVLATGFGVYGAVTDAKWALGIAAALTAVTTGLAKVLPVQAAQGARAQVTPLNSPQGVDGTPLVPVDNVGDPTMSRGDL